MEDSYTVHRRRKAAARKREKTPEPKKAREEKDGESSSEDDSVARAKMERMVEDTENMAKEQGPGGGLENEGKIVSESNKTRTEKIADSEKLTTDKNEREPETEFGIMKTDVNYDTVNRKSLENNEEPDKFRSKITVSTDGVIEPRDSDVPYSSAASLNKSSIASDIEKPAVVEKDKKSEENIDESSPRQPVLADDGEDKTGDAVVQNLSSQHGEIRPRKRNKEKFLLEKSNYGTDSSDGDEKIVASIRRKKSPEVTKPKSLSTGRSRPPLSNDTDEDRNTSNNESRVKPIREKRNVSKHRYSTGTEDESSPKKIDLKKKGEKKLADLETRQRLREKRSVSRHRYPSDTDEELGTTMMKKSETFPQKSGVQQIIRRSASEMKKQIIPLSDDSLIEDFAKAQEDYLRRERGILAPDSGDENYSSKSSDAKVLRRRKIGVLHSDPEEILKKREKKAADVEEKQKSWFSGFSFFRRKQQIGEPASRDKKLEGVPTKTEDKVTFIEFLKALKEIVSEFKAYVDQNPRETAALRKMRNCCIGELILVIIYCGLGAFVFRFTEGAFETFYKCGVKRVKRDFLDNLWSYSHSMREDDWKSMARRKLMEFEEQLHSAHEAGVHSYSGQKSWTFLNAISYCLTVITTIGYGHISPRTWPGRAITIVYAIFGIPIFLIILADFGKLFTRGIKFLWAFVRRLYYTGSCRKVRRTGPVQEVMKGVQLVYDLATFRRPSQFNPEDIEEMQRQQIHTETILNLDGNAPNPETPGTPAMSNFAIDDEFNLPISVAISILLGYIFVGATAYHMFEEWDFFESFYFVFISMSTIGFGDFVPKNPIFMMFSIVYLVFGLALTSMCINVVQTVLSDSFKQASQKISATIGFEVPPEEGEVGEGVQVQVAGVDQEADVADVQVGIKGDEKREEIAPKAKQEDVDI